MIFNGNKQKAVFVDETLARRLQWQCCGALLDEISERHDSVLGGLESHFREVIGRDDDEFVVARQQLELAVQDMFFEMVSAAFWEGVQLGMDLEVKAPVLSGNGLVCVEIGEVV